jgi:demethylmenaquinone methyltransferase/2-methoxy-6-polyprenyl-1,4-benzoquinol methylase
MLKRGAAKTRSGKVFRAGSDTLVLPFASGTFDGATVGFGVRNLTDIEAGFAELARVLKPGARLVVLDCATPGFAPLRAVYLAYFKHILPVVGRMISGHPTAYSYLPDSVAAFPPPEGLEALMTSVGLRNTGHRLLTGGIAALTWGEK